ncbi:hypothetical protein GCM10011391_04860 [Pullulanibacillus camelliae]|uniref:histidine kinase n=1 Tax=Pullulanibacillus camelliae TaxID=1707096 RepID=A0A8J2VL20_9BACL|nr:ATP-binding protein [Pullulanibacillus camelliae]GGE29350.1 hypothetical protein GCM10011391_04860 [Pullulanibacillus camelliae]
MEDKHALSTHQLKDLNESKKLTLAGQLAAGIAHEIKNPLTAIKGFLHLIKADYHGNDMYINVITEEINRIESIITELLILAKPTEAKLTQCSITQILDQVITLLNTVAHLKGTEIQANYAPNLPLLFCDENKIKQVFINLLNNALEAMNNGGIINVVVTSENEHLIIQIIDQGTGMSKEQLDKVGQPFYTTKENGTGLGLMICRQIIENHQGRITFSSSSSGTTVTIDLPAQSQGLDHE